MQTAKIIPIQRANPVGQPQKQEAVEWIMPGQVLTIAPEIQMGIAYDKVDGEYVPRFKFYHNATRLKDIYPNKRHQIDLRTSCRRVITILTTKHHEYTGRQIKTLVEIAHAPYSWEK